MGRRCIGLDVYREFAQVAVWGDGLVRQAGQIALCDEALRVFADSLGPEDEVAVEATCNTQAIVRLIEGHVARVVVSNPQKTRAIAEAKVKTDKVDAQVLAQLLAADYLPSVWVADQATQALRRQVARRAHIVRQRTRLKNRVQAILHRNLIPRCPAADLLGIKGRCWLANQPLGADEQLAVEALLRQLDFHARELRIIDAELGRVALAGPEVKRLMTIPGVDATVALSIVAAVGDFRRFRSPEQLVCYLGLNPRVKQSGGQPASHGRITKQGRAHARGMLVEAAWAAAKTPGPLRAFYERIRGRRGMQIAVVATARKLAVLCWTMIERGEDYAFARPSLTDKKAPRAAAARRDALPAWAEGQGRGVLPQGCPSARTRARRARRAGIPPAGRRLAGQPSRQQQAGRGRRQRDATDKALGGASCAAGITPRTCASLGGRPRPRTSLTPPDTRPQTTPQRDDASARPDADNPSHPAPDSPPSGQQATPSQTPTPATSTENDQNTGPEIKPRP
jgi:transposase